MADCEIEESSFTEALLDFAESDAWLNGAAVSYCFFHSVIMPMACALSLSEEARFDAFFLCTYGSDEMPF